MWGKPAARKRTRVSCHDVNIVLRCLQVHLVPRYLVFIQAHQVAQLFLNLATTEHAHQHEGEVVVAKGGACTVPWFAPRTRAFLGHVPRACVAGCQLALPSSVRASR